MKVVPLVIFFSILLQGCGGFVGYMGDQAEEQNVVENGSFKLRISKLESAPGFMTPSRYLVESSANGAGWVEVYQWGQDDPWTVSDMDIQALSPTIGYFFQMTQYGVTVDEGKSWKLFNVYETMQKDGTHRIQNGFAHGVLRVNMKEDGTGTIYAQDYYDKNGPKQIIYTTTDFGQNWQLPESATLVSK